MEFKIIEAKEQNAAELLEMIRLMAHHEGEADAVENTVEKIKKVLREGKIRAYIVNADNQAAAYLIYFYTYSSYQGTMNMYIEDIFVQEAYRGFGLGKKLMSFAAKEAVRQGCRRLDWTCVKENENAIEFYNHLGGKYMDERMFYRLTGEDLEKLS